MGVGCGEGEGEADSWLSRDPNGLQGWVQSQDPEMARLDPWTMGFPFTVSPDSPAHNLLSALCCFFTRGTRGHLGESVSKASGNFKDKMT